MLHAIAALLAAGTLTAPGGGRADVLAIAAAGDVRPALDEIAAAFRERNPGVEVSVSYGATGALAAQIASGAPFDVFFSADEATARRLVDSGNAVAESVTVYGVGRLALWLPRASPLDLGAGIGCLLDARARRIAVANPVHAPYGRAAEAALRARGVYEAVRERLVFGESVAQAAQFAESGNADAALIPVSLALTPALARAGRHAVVPEGLHPALRQAAAVTERARRNVAAAAFLRFATGPDGRAVLGRWGFGAPGS